MPKLVRAKEVQSLKQKSSKEQIQWSVRMTNKNLLRSTV